eukprot:1161926-Pelagomonas_calceolata.AAC.3
MLMRTPGCAELSDGLHVVSTWVAHPGDQTLQALPFTLEGLSEPSGSESSEGEEVQEQNEEPEQQETSSSRRINTGRRALVPRKRISHGRVYDSVLGITCHW